MKRGANTTREKGGTRTAWASIVPSRKLQHQLKREALLRAAVSAFNERGFHQTGLEDIAGKLGVTKAALYYYFPNKNALLAACFDRAMDIAEESLAEAQAKGRNGREVVVLMLRRYLEDMIEDLGECLLLTEDHALNREGRARLIERRDRLERRLRETVKAGIADGSIVACDPKLAVFVLLGAINWVPKWFSRQGPWKPAQMARGVTDMLDRMLSATPAETLVDDVGKLAKTE